MNKWCFPVKSDQSGKIWFTLQFEPHCHTSFWSSTYLVTLCSRKMVLLLSMVTSRLILTRRSYLSCLVSSSCWKPLKTSRLDCILVSIQDNIHTGEKAQRLSNETVPLKARVTCEDGLALPSRSCMASAFFRGQPSPDMSKKYSQETIQLGNWAQWIVYSVLATFNFTHQTQFSMWKQL